MGRRVTTFMLVPAFSGFFAMMLFQAQRGPDGPCFPLIAFFELPSVTLTLPAHDFLHSLNDYENPLDVHENHDFLLVIGLPTLMNLGLFALAGFVSWTWFPSLRIDLPAKGSSGRLSRAGGTIRDVSSSAIQCISGAKDENVVRVENTYGTQALSRACEQATGVDVREKVRQSSPAKQIFAIAIIAFGYLVEACFGCFFLLLYEYARIHDPGVDVEGMKQLLLVLGKLLDPQGALWGTLLFLVGITAGLLLIFTGCVQIAQVMDQDVSINKKATQERFSVP